MNLNSTIIPKSTQLNADDLISGPRTIKITNVLAGSAEQPVQITYEGDTGRPYLPSKSMRRVLVTLWGSEGAAYVGRSITLYRDPTVKFGGDMVGGVKISHASDITGTQSLMLTETRGKRKPHIVEPLVVDTKATPAQIAQVKTLLETVKVSEADLKKGYDKAGVTDYTGMTGAQIEGLITFLNKKNETKASA